MTSGSIRRAMALGLATALASASAAAAGEYNLTVDPVKIEAGEVSRMGIGYNGSAEPTVLRFKEGEDVVINVTNNLSEDTSIHWHGLILPFDQDGVPGISYAGIAPGETFTYRFPIVQNGTYWFHSHSGLQEPNGAYGAIVIDNAEREPFRYDREYVVQLADPHPHHAERVMRNLKQMPDYYNRQQRTLIDFFDDASEKGFGAALEDRQMWGSMRMMPTDIEDVQGYAPLINGRAADEPFRAAFEPGERIRLRFINSSAMAFYDIRIPGLEMTVVQADGNNVLPVKVDEFRIAVAETYDVIVRPREAGAFNIIAESIGRATMGRGVLASDAGLPAPAMPTLREPPLLTMADMRLSPLHQGMGHEGHDMGGGAMMHDTAGGAMTDGAGAEPSPTTHKMADGSMMAGPAHDGDHGGGMHKMADGTMMSGMDHSAMGQEGGHQMAGEMDHGNMNQGGMNQDGMNQGGMNQGGMDHSAMGHDMGAMGESDDPFFAPGSGLTPEAANGGKFLSYADLKAQDPLYPDREATREIEMRLTGNMERYLWSINGVKYEDADPVVLQYGERVRFKFVNETMMTHPMHLHGMWSIIDNGTGARDPIKHVVTVNPGTVVYMETEVDAPGQWAFHCHLSYHADTGMFRKIVVQGGPEEAALTTPDRG